MFPAGQKQARMDLPALLVTVQAGPLLTSQQLAADVNDAITAGATAVLLDGSDNAAALYEAAVKVKELLRERAALLLLDRLDIAAAVGAEGVVLSPTGEPGATHVHTGWGEARQDATTHMPACTHYDFTNARMHQSLGFCEVCF